jgi:hypothetical protein
LCVFLGAGGTMSGPTTPLGHPASFYALTEALLLCHRLVWAAAACVAAAFLLATYRPAARWPTTLAIVAAACCGNAGLHILTPFGAIGGFTAFACGVALVDAPAAAATWLLWRGPGYGAFTALQLRAAAPSLSGLLAAFMVLTVAAPAAVADACYCNHPAQVSTRLSRMLTPAVCAPGAVCHEYPLVGADCSRMGLVYHYVARHDETVTGANVRLLGAGSAADAAGAPVTFSTPDGGDIAHDELIDEDRRFVVRFGVSGLRCGAAFAAHVTIHIDTAGGGQRTVTAAAPMKFHTFAHSDRGATFIAGGDLEAAPVGYEMLRHALRLQPDADFLVLGGDVAYANNIRHCYRRWDAVLAELSLLRRTDGSRIPLLVAVGNHEGGGYLRAGLTRGGRRAVYNAFTAYFPSADHLSGHHHYRALPSTAAWLGDPTITFQRVVVAGSAWLVLDTDVMLSLRQQRRMVQETLALWTGAPLDERDHGDRSKWSAPHVRRVTVVLHVPAFPSYRRFGTKYSANVRDVLLPLLTRYRVALVLEHHDHAYKRSVRLVHTDDGPVPVTDLAAFGTTFVGDGGLGVGVPSEELRDRWYLQRRRAGNSVLIGDVHGAAMRLRAVDYQDKAFVDDIFVG